MNEKWNELTQKEKKLFIVSYVLYGLAALALVADYMKLWAHANNAWLILLGIGLEVECVLDWDKNRKFAIVKLLGGILTIAIGVGSILLS